MNRIGLILLMSLAGGAYAQGTDGGVTMSTDPAKAAAVESRARELQARQAQEPSSKSAATHKTAAKPKSSTHAKSGSHAKSTHTSTHTTTKTHTTHTTHKSSSSAKPAKT